MAADLSFVDSNVLVYAFDTDEPDKRQRAQDLLNGADADRMLWSTQVLGEFFNVATRKLGMSATDARGHVEALAPRARVPIDQALVLEALAVHAAASLSYWDALIVAAAARAKCSLLFTEDLNAGEVISGVEIVNPFL